MRVTMMAVGAMAFCLGGAAIAETIPAFDRAAFEASFNGAFQNRDANAVGKMIAANYNEGGVSKPEFVRQLHDLFKKADVNVDYHLSDFHQIAGTNLGYVKLTAKMSTRPVPQIAKNGHAGVLPVALEEPRVVRTTGYATLAYEGSSWKLLATAAADCAQDENGPAMQGVSWGSQVNPAGFSAMLISSANRPVFQETSSKHVFEAPQGNLPAFDQTEWETRFRNAWNTKNLTQIMSFYSAHFTDLGMDLPQIEQGFKTMLDQYETIHVDYKVVGVRFPTGGAPVASIKAELDLRGIKKGSSTSEVILKTGGTASLVVEDGKWKTFAVQPLQTVDVGEQAYQLALASSNSHASLTKP